MTLRTWMAAILGLVLCAAGCGTSSAGSGETGGGGAGGGGNGGGGEAGGASGPLATCEQLCESLGEANCLGGSSVADCKQGCVSDSEVFEQCPEELQAYYECEIENLCNTNLACDDIQPGGECL